jgi:hypothetical protein
MPTLNQTDKLLDAEIERLISNFEAGTLSTEKNVFNEVLGLIKGFDIDRDGNLKQTTKNIRLLTTIRNKIEPVVLNDAYKKRVASFGGGFSGVSEITDEYLASIRTGFAPNQALKDQILKYQLEVTGNSLAGAGIEAQVIDPVKDMIQKAVTQGGGYVDLVDELRIAIKGIEEGAGMVKGSLSRYTNQIATDSLNQYSRNYVQAISKDLDFEWYRYSGGIKSNSRSYCKKRAGRHFHIEEIEQSSHLKWSGKMKGTNESNILTNCGGYNCGHRYLPVADVPQRVKDRAIKKGYIKANN